MLTDSNVPRAPNFKTRELVATLDFEGGREIAAAPDFERLLKYAEKKM